MTKQEKKQVNEIIESLVNDKSKLGENTFRCFLKHINLSEDKMLEAILLGRDAKILKGIRTNNDSEKMISFRVNYQSWLKEQYNLGNVYKDKLRPNKDIYILFDNKDDRRSLDINMSNLDERARKIKKSGLEVSKETLKEA